MTRLIMPGKLVKPAQHRPLATRFGHDSDCKGPGASW